MSVSCLAATAVLVIWAFALNVETLWLGQAAVPQALQDVIKALSLPQGNATLSSALHWRDCQPHLVLRPQHTEHVADLLMALHRDSQATGQRYHVRASRQGFHSTNDFSCAASRSAAAAAAASSSAKVGSAGSSSANVGSTSSTSGTSANGDGSSAAAAGGAAGGEVLSVSLDTSAMSRVIRLNLELPVITVQAGMTFEELEDVLFAHQLGLPNVYLTPVHSGMTLGAALVTGAHGSALKGYATLAPYVRRAVMVDGSGEVRVIQWPGELLEGSLGLLGVVTEMTLLLAPARKVRVKQVQAEDLEMVSDLREIMDQSQAQALDVTWSPAAGMYTARVWHSADEVEAAEAAKLSVNTFMQAASTWLDKMDARVHRDQQDELDRGAVMCELLGDMDIFPHFAEAGAQVPAVLLATVPPQDTYVGWLPRMAAPRCPPGGLPDCLWRRLRVVSHEFGISGEDFGSWVEDARRILAKAHNCPAFTINMRFLPSTNSPLAMHFGRQTIAVDISTIASLAAPRLHIKQQHLLDELLQMTMCRYEGRPHWAAGTNRLFTGPCPVRDMYGPHFDSFLLDRARFDPSDLFYAPLFGRVVERRTSTFYPGCAVDNECFCQEDAHCGPHHVCVPGLVFAEYNVCAPQAIARPSASTAEL